jgi:hypothetical protein
MAQATNRNVNAFLDTLYQKLKHGSHPKRYVSGRNLTLTRASLTYEGSKVLIKYITEMEGPTLIPENEGRIFKERHGFNYESCIETYFLNRTEFDVVLIEDVRDIMYLCRNL